MSEAVALARQWKARCYASWHTDPSEVLRCAAELGDLAAATEGTASGGEIAALSQWTRAIGDLVEGRLASAVERLDTARVAFESLGLDADAAQTRVPGIMGLALLGRFDAALDCAEKAREALLAMGDRGSAAKVQLNTGSLCMQRDRYADASRHYREASVLFARVGDREHSVLADVGCADALAYLGDSARAEAHYRRALRRAERHGLPVIEAAVVQALAELALARGSYGEALAGLERASRDFAGLGLPLLQVEAEKSLADTYFELRLLPEADGLYRHVLETLGPQEGAATQAWVWLKRAQLGAARNDRASALDALATAERLFGEMDNPAGIAAAQLARSELLLAGGAVDAARLAAEEAVARHAALGLPAAAASLALAEVQAASGAVDEALTGFNALIHARRTPLPLCERAWYGRGRMLLRAGARQAARNAFEQAVDLAEAGRLELPGGDFQRAYLTHRAGAYDELLRLTLDDCDAAPANGSAWAALLAIERRRARTLRDRLGPAASVAERRQPEMPEVAARRVRLDWLYRRLNRYLREGEVAEAPETLQAERAALEQWLLEHGRRERIAQAGSAPTQSAPAAEALDATTLHAALGPTTALVAYAEMDAELLAVTVSQGRVRLHRRVADSADVRATIGALRNQLATQQLGGERLGRHAPLLAERTQRVLARLHDLVWQPLAAALVGAGNVRVVACAGLAGLPFAALWDGGAHLVERHAISFAASVDSAIRTRPASRSGRVAAIADTTRLAGALAEMAALRACWPGATLRVGSDATLSALRSEAAQADLLHLACHGEFRADSPLFSALHLHDGTLTALDAETLPLAASLVVLSGCETALADTARDDEAVGLVRAFLIAGARRVLGGLWRIDDAATARWMSAFHAALAAGAAPAQAMRAVQRRFIAEGAHPYVWAPFVLHGEA